MTNDHRREPLATTDAAIDLANAVVIARCGAASGLIETRLKQESDVLSTSTRRQFLHGTTAAAMLGLTGQTRAQSNADARASDELDVVNAVVHTIDDRQPKAEAFFVRHGRFVAVGSNAEIRKHVTPGARRTRRDRAGNDE